MQTEDLKNKKIAILGFGKEGQAAFRFLMKNNISDISIVDQKLKEEEIQNIVKRLGYALPVEKIFSEERQKEVLETSDFILKSP